MTLLNPQAPPTVPMSRFPYTVSPYPNTTPFTTRDGITFIDRLEGFIQWVEKEFVPYIDSLAPGLITKFQDVVDELNKLVADTTAEYLEQVENFTDFSDEQKAAIAADVAAFRTLSAESLATIKTYVDGVESNAVKAGQARAAAETARDLAQQYANAAVAFQDTAVANFIRNPDSQIGAALDLRVDARIGQRLSVRLFGAKGDGNTDDTAAFNNAIRTAKSEGSSVYVPPGRYVIEDVLLLGGVSIEGTPRSIIVPKTDTKSAFRSDGDNGGEEAAGTVAANVAAGATSISITGSTGTLVPGDYIVLYDNFVYDPNAVSTTSGEILTVKAVSPGFITLQERVRGSFANGRAYTLANGVKINKLKMASGISMSNLVFDGKLSSTTPLVNLYYVANMKMENLSVLKHGDNFISMKLAKNVSIVGGNIDNLLDDLANNHIGYGIHMSNACDAITITNVTSNNTRHAITTTGGGKGIPRNITVTNCVISNATVAGIDSHAATDGMTISGNVVTSSSIGITIRGKRTLVSGNLISQCDVAIRFAETLVADAVVQGNTLLDSVAAIVLSDPCVGVTIAHNVIRRMSSHGMRISAEVNGLTIIGNALFDGQVEGITFVNTGRVAIIDNTFTDMCTGGAGNYINGAGNNGAQRVDFTGNKFINTYMTTASRCINTSRSTGMVGNTSFGTFNGTRWAVNGVNQAGNTEV